MSSTSTSKNDQDQDQARSALQRLQTLRDEIRVRIHLGGMELKEVWRDLEGKILDAEKWVEGAASDALAKLQALTPQVEELTNKLPGKESAAQKQDVARSCAACPLGSL
jgi:predicted  nucleic acid-binding Zn-ribbon protein